MICHDMSTPKDDPVFRTFEVRKPVWSWHGERSVTGGIFNIWNPQGQMMDNDGLMMGKWYYGEIVDIISGGWF